MSRTSKSPRKVALEALAIGNSVLPAHFSKYSRKDFTLPQIFACLVLKCFFRTDFRGISAILLDMPDLCQAIGLGKVPHFTTLQKMHQRLLNQQIATQLLDETVCQALGPNPYVDLAAGDSTGIESSQISPYFIKRRSHKHKTPQITTYSHYPKLELLCDCSTHLVLAAMTALGPHPDIDRLRPLLFAPLSRGIGIGTGLFDAGYDSESNHRFARDCCHIRSVIPPTNGRPPADPSQPPPSYWRRRMWRYRDYRYGQRWQVETAISMIKRRLGGYVLNRSNPARFAEMMLKVLTHNIMLIVFYLRQLDRTGMLLFVAVTARISTEQVTGTYFSPRSSAFGFFRGRHGSLTAPSSPYRPTTRFIHFSSPNGRPRFTLTLSRSTNRSSIGSFTIAAQFRGRSTGQSSSSTFTPPLPAALLRLDHDQSSARLTIFARSGLLSTYRISVRKCPSSCTIKSLNRP